MFHFNLKFPAQVAQLFRATSLATTLMDQYMKMTSSEFVRQAVQGGVMKIMELKHSCEVSKVDTLSEIVYHIFIHFFRIFLLQC